MDLADPNNCIFQENSLAKFMIIFTYFLYFTFMHVTQHVDKEFVKNGDFLLSWGSNGKEKVQK
jgi:hypothetical protein